MKSKQVTKFKETEIGKIPEYWEIKKLENICTLFVPMRNKPKEFDGDIPWIKIEDIEGKFVSNSKSKQYVSPEIVNEMNLRIFPVGTVLCSCTATIGVCAITQKELVTNQQFIGIYPTCINNEFLYYYLLTQTENLKNIAYGTVAGYITRQRFEDFQVILPPINEQKSIVKILSDLDSKIEILQKQNKILEQITQIIFKSWFIDFDGITEFEDSELGQIPKGWTLKQLDEIANFLNGLALQKFRPLDDTFLPVIKIREMKNGFTENTEKASTDIEKKYIINNGDVLFSWSATLEVIVWGFGKGALNQHIFKVTSDEYEKWFYYLWTKFHLNEFRNIAKDKTTTMGHIKREHLSDALVLIPTTKTLEQMNNVMDPFFNQFIENNISIQNLKNIHDSLLPKLMSGEIRV